MPKKLYTKGVLTFAYHSDIKRPADTLAVKMWKELKQMSEEDFIEHIQFS